MAFDIILRNPGSGFSITLGANDGSNPVITNRSAYTILPRRIWSIELTADTPVTWTKTGGANSSDFVLSDSTLTLSGQPSRTTKVVEITATDDLDRETVITVTVNTIKARRRARGY